MCPGDGLGGESRDIQDVRTWFMCNSTEIGENVRRTHGTLSQDKRDTSTAWLLSELGLSRRISLCLLVLFSFSSQKNRYRPKGVLQQRCSAHFWRNFDAFWNVPLFQIKQNPFWRISDAFLMHSCYCRRLFRKHLLDDTEKSTEKKIQVVGRRQWEAKPRAQEETGMATRHWGGCSSWRSVDRPPGTPTTIRPTSICIFSNSRVKWSNRSAPECTTVSQFFGQIRQAAPGLIERGVPRRGVPLGNRLQIQRRCTPIRIRGVYKPVWRSIKETLSTCPEPTVAPDACRRTHFCGTPLCGTPLSVILTPTYLRHLRRNSGECGGPSSELC